MMTGGKNKIPSYLRKAIREADRDPHDFEDKGDYSGTGAIAGGAAGAGIMAHHHGQEMKSIYNKMGDFAKRPNDMKAISKYLMKKGIKGTAIGALLGGAAGAGVRLYGRKEKEGDE